MSQSESSGVTTVSLASDASSNYWDLVYAAAVGGYAAAVEEGVPRSPPQLGWQELNGSQWIRSVLSDPRSSKINLRMEPAQFQQLHDRLVMEHGLRDYGDFDTMEGLGMFIWALAKGMGQRDMAERCKRSLGVVSERFAQVLKAMVHFSDYIIQPRQTDISKVQDAPHKYTPFFDGAIGALDGTHIKVIVGREHREAYLNRHGDTSQNVLAICEFDMWVTFVGCGMAGSNHDMYVLREAKRARRFPHPPNGRYYLADSGYASERGYLVPHKQRRYWLREFENRPAESAEEMFNYHHSSLRNVVERLFSHVKGRWHMLKEVPHYPMEKQSDIIKCGFGLHNFLLTFKEAGQTHALDDLSMQWLVANENENMDQVRLWITAGLTHLGFR